MDQLHTPRVVADKNNARCSDRFEDSVWLAVDAKAHPCRSAAAIAGADLVQARSKRRFTHAHAR